MISKPGDSSIGVSGLIAVERYQARVVLSISVRILTSNGLVKVPKSMTGVPKGSSVSMVTVPRLNGFCNVSCAEESLLSGIPAIPDLPEVNACLMISICAT